jgi:hypothetical protein
VLALAGLFTGLENLPGVFQKLHLHELSQDISCVIAAASTSSRLSQPPLDVRQGERGPLDVAASPAPAVGDVALEHGHGVALDLRPVVAMREERDALHVHAPPRGRTKPSQNLAGCPREGRKP